MNVIVIPDASMIVIPLIEKNGHTYISPSDFSKNNNMDICEGNLEFKNVFGKYTSSELPSGVKSRLNLFSNVADKADAAIIIGKRPSQHVKMYNALNDLILFGGNSCNNAHSLMVKIVEDLKIPTLKLAYPVNRENLICMINRTNSFLKNLKSANDDDLNTDLYPRKDNVPACDVKKILDNLI